MEDTWLGAPISEREILRQFLDDEIASLAAIFKK